MTDEEIKALVTGTVGSAFDEFQKTKLPAMFVPVTDQLKTIGETLTALKTPPVVKDPVVVPPVVKDPVVGLTPELNTMFKDLQKAADASALEVKKLTDKNAESEKRADAAERRSVIDASLNSFVFQSDAARANAVTMLESQIKRTETGQLVAGDNLTPDAFIKAYIPEQHPYLLAPVNVGGTGVNTSTHSGTRKAVDMDGIKPGMTSDERAATIAAIQNAASGLGLKI